MNGTLTCAAASPSADLTALTTEMLEAEVVDLAGRISAATAHLLDLIAELDRRSAWGTWGCRSMAHWLSWHAGVELGTAREQVRTARALEALPLTAEKFRRGELSYSKARALTRVATPGTETDLVDVATTATAAQLEHFVQAYRRSLVAEEERAVLAIDRRSVRWWWDDDGTLRVSGRLPADDGAQFIAGLKAVLDTVPRTTDDLHQRQADALAAMAEGFLAATPATRTGGDRTQVVLHVEPEALADPASARDESTDDDVRAGGVPTAGVPAGDVPAGTSRPLAHLEDGPSLATSTVRRLCCDAGVVPVVEGADGAVLDVGRRTRTIPRAIRRALARRDRGCRFPGCTHTRWVDAHHLVHWGDGGPTSLENLCLLCRFHHRLVHEGGYRIEMADDGSIQVRHPAGWLLEPIAPAASSGPAASSRPTASSGPAASSRPAASSGPAASSASTSFAASTVSGPGGALLPLAAGRPDALRATWAGEHFDLDLAIWATRWSQIREGALPPVLPPGVSAGTSDTPSAARGASPGTSGTPVPHPPMPHPPVLHPPVP